MSASGGNSAPAHSCGRKVDQVAPRWTRHRPSREVVPPLRPPVSIDGRSPREQGIGVVSAARSHVVESDLAGSLSCPDVSKVDREKLIGIDDDVIARPDISALHSRSEVDRETVPRGAERLLLRFGQRPPDRIRSIVALREVARHEPESRSPGGGRRPPADLAHVGLPAVRLGAHLAIDRDSRRAADDPPPREGERRGRIVDRVIPIVPPGPSARRRARSSRFLRR